MTRDEGPFPRSRRLRALLALASRPGTPAEGETALRHAERVAARDELVIVETYPGVFVLLDDERADLLRALQEIAAGKTDEAAAAELSGG